MRIMNARNFRAQFTTVGEPVTVISKERIIGVWTPQTSGARIMGIPVRDETIAEINRDVPLAEIAGGRPMTQTERDVILRKINRKP